MAGDEQLRAGDDFYQTVPRLSADVAELALGIIGIGDGEGGTALTFGTGCDGGVAVGVGGEGGEVSSGVGVGIVGTEDHAVSVVAGGAGEFQTELGGFGEGDFHHQNLEQNLRGNDIKFVEQSFD